MQIELQNVSFCYKQFGSSTDTGRAALNRINLKINHHELIGIVGPSGSGKTTLIQTLNGLLKPDQGTVLIDNQPALYKGDFSHNWHKQVSIVFQFPEMQFFENSVYDEIAFALRNQNLPEQQISERVRNVSTTLEIFDENFQTRSPFNLSEGQKRRVAIASILVLEPEILMLDEPTAGLDYSGIQILKRVIQNIYNRNKTIIIVSHDVDFVAEMTQRIITLSEGRIGYDGPKQDFFLNENLISKSHLELPQIMKLAKKLKQQGKDIKYPVYSVEELKRSLRM